MTKMEFGGVVVGANVDIQRTDGRVHSAVVSGVNTETRSVTVEWFERGETKGKEIEVDAIFSLNPDLVPSQTPSKQSIRQQAHHHQQNHEDSNKNVVYNSSQHNNTGSTSNNRGTHKENRASIMRREAASVATATTVASSTLLHGNMSRYSMAGAHQQQTTTAAAKQRPSYAKVAPQQNGHGGGRRETKEQSADVTTLAGDNESGSGVNIGAPPVPAQVSRLKQQERQQQSMQQQQQQQQQQDAKNRRSNVVKEIDRIRENRENRRRRQEESKNAAADENMAGHPNWEFLQMIREYHAGLDFQSINEDEPVQDHQICVCVRKRPVNKKELGRRDIDVVTIADGQHTMVHEPKTKVDMTKYLENQTFRFDYSFDETVTNEIVYKYTAKPLVETIFDKGMATCFAYGQTGSGKTHTMGGDFHGKTQDVAKGIYVMVAKDVFRLINSPRYKKHDLAVSCSFFEIYSGKVFDLMNKKQKLRVLEDGKQQVQIVGLREDDVKSVDDVMKLIAHGNTVRTSGQTSANQHSSRSHAVLQIILRKKGLKRLLHGKFSLIDLAGNERGADTSSSNRQTRMEGAEINKSLLALKECIRALGRAKGAHLPFRASKLTQVLRDSFIGDNSRTCMIAMISPCLTSCEHTLNTLRYADRVKELGPGGPVEVVRHQPARNAALSPTNSDLAMLYTHDDEEASADMYTYQENVNHLQELEDDVIDEFRSVLQEWYDNGNAVLEETNAVDYDVDAFAVKLEGMVSGMNTWLNNFTDKVKSFNQQLKEEENQSKNMSTKKRPK